MVITAVIVCGIAYALSTASWERPDEFGHFSYMKHIQKSQSLPSYTSVYDFWEAHQPPLHYIVTMPALYITSGSSITVQLMAVRIMNVLIAAVNVFVLYKLFSLLFSKFVDEKLAQYYIAISTVLAAFWPMFVFISSSVNNDNLANLLGSVSIYWMLRLPKLFENSHSIRRGLVVSALIIIASLLTKVGLAPLSFTLFIVTLYYLYTYSRSTTSFSKKNFIVTVILYVAAIMAGAGWFFIRNKVVVGDFLGWKFFDYLLVHQESNLLEWAVFIDWLKKIMKSTLGIFGYFDIYIKPIWAYTVFQWLLVVSFAGNVYFFIRNRKQDIGNVKLLYFLLLLTFMSTFIYSLSAYQPQGRYLFPCLACIITFLIIGTVVHFKKPFVLQVILAVVAVGMPLYALVNLDHIRAVEARSSAGADGRVDLLTKTWNRENTTVEKKVNSADQSVESITVTLSDIGTSRMLVYGEIRIETDTTEKMIIEAKSESVITLTVTPSFMGENSFNSEYASDIKLLPDGEYHEYILDAESFIPTKADIITGFEVGFTSSTDEATVIFKEISIQ